tara:strand:+ start:1166 stop:1387 length:222 start_codon:yes stop_codon:yes gene_type:complete
MDLLTRYTRVKDTLEDLQCRQGNAYDHDQCLFDIDGYYDCGIDDKDVLRERVEALENLAKAIERVNETEVIYS